MKYSLLNFISCAIVYTSTHFARGADKIDILTFITKSDAETILGDPLKEPELRNEESANGFVSKCTYRTVQSTESVTLRPAPLNKRDSYTQPRGGIVVPTTQPNKMLKIEVHVVADKVSAEQFFMVSGPGSWMTSVDAFGKKHGFEPVEGLGEKAAFLMEVTGERSRSRLHVLKGNTVVIVGITGVSDVNALEQEKAIAAKILAHL
jgi:hypothetical protein